MKKNLLKKLPAPVIEEHEGFLVVRDDLLPGGTKRRALLSILFNIKAREVVYPATAHGYGQLALAYAGKDAGKKVTLFLADRKNFESAPIVAETMAKTNAEYHFIKFPNFMNCVVARAGEYANKNGAELMPLGFDMPEFLDELVKVAKSLPIEPPKEVWVAGGTGTLARAFQKAWPHAKINVVSMGMKNGDMGNATVYEAPEKFAQKAKNPPPYPAASHYDAKVWQFAKKYGRKGALIWNVGK